MTKNVCTAFLTILLISGCTVSHGVSHEVGKGETLWRIAKTYNVDLQEIAEANNITDVTQVKSGQKIFIPGADRVLEVKPYTAKGQEKNKEEKEEKITFEKGKFIWPVKGEIVSPFGVRDGRKHDGIDISAPSGTDVIAADDGEIIYCGDGMRGYGNIIIIQHKDNFVTIYAHNKENLVKVADYVKKGDVIAKVGNTGNSSGYHLHFEVRKDRKPRNPVFFLP
ncbi:MAG TPA: hypothetical protein DD641_09645 [Deltaproteobacteria bacterium]|nr:hypothetical protein [Deltaproteobacteria bacterium]